MCNCSYANLSKEYKQSDDRTRTDRKKRRAADFATQMPSMIEAYNFYQRQRLENEGQNGENANAVARPYVHTVDFDVDEDEFTFEIMAIGADCKSIAHCSLSNAIVLLFTITCRLR